MGWWGEDIRDLYLRARASSTFLDNRLPQNYSLLVLLIRTMGNRARRSLLRKKPVVHILKYGKSAGDRYEEEDIANKLFAFVFPFLAPLSRSIQ